MNTFTAHTPLDGSAETPIIQEFDHFGHTWVVHNSIKRDTDKFKVSHKDTGLPLRDYRPGFASLFGTPDSARTMAINFLNHVGQQQIDFWIGRVKVGGL